MLKFFAGFAYISLKHTNEDPDVDDDLLEYCWAHVEFAVDVSNDFCTLGPLPI